MKVQIKHLGRWLYSLYCFEISITAYVFSKNPRHREVKFPLLDHAMSLWVENVTAGGVTLTDLLIKEKARIFAQALNIQENELVFSNGWLEKFKKRNNIKRYRAHGEAGSAPLESLPEERKGYANS